MELRRSRRVLVLCVAFTVFGLALVVTGLPVGTARDLFYGILGALCIVIGVVFGREERKPFRFGIGPQGLTLRVAGIHRLVPWTEIDALVLDQPVPKLHGRRSLSCPQLVLVPAAGSDLVGGGPQRSLPDGRIGRLVLDLDDVRQSREQIAAALRTYGGDRFTDALRERQSRIGAHVFSMVLRGYDPAAVDELLRQAADALGSGEYMQRIGARLRMENPSIPVVNRGYDRQQVDDALAAIAEQLAELLPPEETR